MSCRGCVACPPTYQRHRLVISGRPSWALDSRARVGARPANKHAQARSQLMPEQHHVSLVDSERPAASHAIRVRDADPTSPVEVTVSLSGPEPPGPDSVPGQGLGREEFDAAYGASREDADKAVAVLRRYGLEVDDEDVSLGTRSIRARGTVEAMENAFHANLGVYHGAGGREFRGREGELKIPAELDGVLTGVFGLDQRRVARRRGAPAAAHALAPLTPSVLEAHYNFPEGEAQGQRIGIAEFGGGYFPDDLVAFCQKHNLPQAQVELVPVGLTPLTFQQIASLPQDEADVAFDETGEVMMDVQIVAGLCQQARLSVYFAPFDQRGWIDLLNQAILDRPVALSVSWGLSEDDPNWTPIALTEINHRLALAAARGITVCVASGDDGSGDQLNDGGAHVDFPSSSPFVLSVGGTMITTAHTPLVEETWWRPPGRRNGSGGGSTGGGVSTVFARPGWQQNIQVPSLNSGAIDGRVVPDVAALAGPPLYDLTLLGEDRPNGGTSASAPLWASLIARVNALLPAAKRQRFLTPLLYDIDGNGRARGEGACADISVGQNASHPFPGVGYEAQPGFDAVTGWGLPDGVALLNSL
ncbi:S8/S53 family peptidase [Streptomyces sp. ISID311]|nr:S8/S53 family peptidase [Streptomyces sp. ISID311]